MDINGFSLRDIDVNCRVNMDKVITGKNCVFEGFLHTVHGILCGPFLHTLLVLEPRTAVIYGHNAASGVVHSVSLKLEKLGELSLVHPRVSAVAVDLIEGGSEVDWGMVTLCSAERCTDHRK